MENLNKHSINNGVILGILSLALQIIIYYAAPSIIGSITFSVVISIFSLLIYIFFTIDLKKKIGGFWTFKEALKGIFVMSLIGNALSSVANFVFFKFIEPDAFEKLSPSIEQQAIANLEKFGITDQKAIDAGVEQALAQVKSIYQPDLKSFAISFATIIIVGFIMSLIFAAIFKKNPPMFAPVEEND
jgi:hypothetical protein